MEPKPFIEGKTVDLRPLSLEDVNDTYVNWLNDAESVRVQFASRVPVHA